MWPGLQLSFKKLTGSKGSADPDKPYGLKILYSPETSIMEYVSALLNLIILTKF